jgi:hypothetical protein
MGGAMIAMLVVMACGGGWCAAEPELPRAYLDTTYVPGTGRTVPVPAGADLQKALDDAQPGDTLSLEAGATFKGNFVPPKKTGVGWITVRTSTPDAKLPPPGRRMTAAWSKSLARLMTPNEMPVLVTVPGAHHFRLLGLEITCDPAVQLCWSLLWLGDGSNAQNSLDQVPTDITVDRCYIHGHLKRDMQRAVSLQSARTAIIDSTISEIHGTDQETQAICGWNGPGPYKIVNNYLEATTENVMFGGAAASIPDLVPSDIEIRGNYFFKPLSWRKDDPAFAGNAYSVKNLFELKNARRVLLEGNVLEHSWVHHQMGFAILLTVRTENKKMPWAVVEDITITHNLIRHCAGGAVITGHDDDKTGYGRRILFRDNVFDDINGDRWGNCGWLFEIVNGTQDVVIDHNTGLGQWCVTVSEGDPNLRAVITNNILTFGRYGVVGTGVGNGNPSIARNFPGCVFQRNVFIAAPAEIRPTMYPPDNWFVAGLQDIRFVDGPSGNYRLGQDSPFRNAGTDGRDLGADGVRP